MMSSPLTPDARHQIEEHIYRPLTDEEIAVVRSVTELSAAQDAVLRELALKHRLVATMYLCGIVRDMNSAEAITIINAICRKAGL